MADHDEPPPDTNNDYAQEDGEMRPIETDFYWDSMNGVWVYKWADTRLVLTADSVKDYVND